MKVSIGHRLGAFEVSAVLGEGGMGKVWRATDSKLGREVALKVLPEGFADDPDRHARFEREAKVLASLNHPNIATLHALEHFDDQHVLVMELVEGEGLDERIARGAIPVDEALPMALQIAEALEAAHEAGIVHRDLKPANIRVRPDGTVKVLDFGLAKAWETDGGDSSLSLSPTMTKHATAAGVILGTAAYMSPEQARGKKVDRRADIWAFGVVLFEMLTGSKLFAGDTISDVLAAVLRAEVDLRELPKGVPPGVETLIGRCLERNPRQRLQAMGEARILLAGIDAGGEYTEPGERVADRPSRFKGILGWAVAVVAIAACGWVWVTRRAPETAQTTVQLSVNLPSGFSLTGPPAISPDGQVIACSAIKDDEDQSRLFLRRLDDFEWQQIERSAGAGAPFFSPDSRWVAFFAVDSIFKASVSGNAPERIASATAMTGGSWGQDDSIVFSTGVGSPLYTVPAAGGKVVELTSFEGDDYAHVWPQHLADGSGLLFVSWSSGADGGSKFLSSSDGARKQLDFMTGYTTLRDAHRGWVMAEENNGSLSAFGFDPVRGTHGAERATIVEQVFWYQSATRSWYALSDEGTLIWAPGDPKAKSVIWVNRRGETETVVEDGGAIGYMEVSPDGSRVLLEPGGDIFTVDLTRGSQTRVTFSEMNDLNPHWTPDGRQIVFASNRDERWALYITSSRGDGGAEQLLKTQYPVFPMSVAPNGNILYQETHPETGRDLWVLAPDGERTAFVLTPFDETHAAFSPDGSHVAYVSNASRRREVYLKSADGSGQTVQVSFDGGRWPAWGGDGKTLYFRSGRAVYEVDVALGEEIGTGIPRKVLDGTNLDLGPFDVTSDGQRFLVIELDRTAKPTEIRVMTNAFSVIEAALEEIRR